MRLDELEKRQWREVEDYLTFLQLTSREEEAQSQQQGRAHGQR